MGGTQGKNKKRPSQIKKLSGKKEKKRKKWREKNPEKAWEKNRMFKEKHPEYQNNWRSKHPEKVRQYDRYQYMKSPERQWVRHTLYRHRRKGLKVIITNEELLNIIRNHRNCQICDRPLDFSNGNKGRQRENSPSLVRRGQGVENPQPFEG